MAYAVLFPGQGSQSVGMGADLFTAPGGRREAAADEVLGWSLRDLCLAGSEEDLTRTDRAQPALFAVSLMLWEAFAESAAAPPAGAAGHSLGEYTALAAAGVLSFETGLRLVMARGAAMARAAAAQPSGMAALIGADAEQAEALAAARRGSGGRLWVANRNAPGQVVLAGGTTDLEWAGAHAGEFGIRRVMPLKVAGAFHSPFMESAASDLSTAVGKTRFGPPRFPVWANATAAPHGADVGSTLLAQLTSPVRFEESLRAMAAEGIETFVHIGPGDVTAGLVRRSIEGGETHVVSSLEEAGRVAERIGTPG